MQNLMKTGSPPIYKTLSSVRQELRQRRKQMLGSYESLCMHTCKNNTIDETAVLQMSDYLTVRTMCFLDPCFKSHNLVRRFYVLALYAISSGRVGNETIDDIIQLAECLARSKDVFVTVVKNLLPENLISDLFDFADSIDETFCASMFEDAVLGAISVFLGVLADPLGSSDSSELKEG